MIPILRIILLLLALLFGAYATHMAETKVKQTLHKSEDTETKQ